MVAWSALILCGACCVVAHVLAAGRLGPPSAGLRVLAARLAAEQRQQELGADEPAHRSAAAEELRFLRTAATNARSSKDRRRRRRRQQ